MPGFIDKVPVLAQIALFLASQEAYSALALTVNCLCSAPVDGDFVRVNQNTRVTRNTVPIATKKTPCDERMSANKTTRVGP